MDERYKEAADECDKGIEVANRFEDLSRKEEGAVDLTAASAFAEQAEKQKAELNDIKVKAQAKL